MRSASWLDIVPSIIGIMVGVSGGGGGGCGGCSSH